MIYPACEVWDIEDKFLQTLCERCHDDLGHHPKGGVYYQREDSGVEGGQVYTSRVEAEFDAERLTAANPVGFVVIPLTEG